MILHHFTENLGPEFTTDPEQFGRRPWSKVERGVAPGHKRTWFYTDPADREHQFEGMSHYSGEVPDSAVYDIDADPKRIVARVGSRFPGESGFPHVLRVLRRLGYKGISRDFGRNPGKPWVAMFEPVRVVKLARSGYGYCPECKGPFLYHDKKKMVVTCPNGHKRRYVKTPRMKLSRAEPIRAAWLSPDGNVIPVPLGKTHGDQAQKAGMSIDDMFTRGWQRLFSVGDDLYSHNDFRPPTTTQRTVLKDHAIENGFTRVIHDSGDNERILWSDDAALIPPSSRLKLARIRAPGGGMIVNAQYHKGGQFLPRAFKRIGATIAARRKVKLARINVLSPEDEAVGTTAASRRTFNRLVAQSLAGEPGVLPTIHEIKALARAGESTKGQYEHAGRVLSKFLGPDNAALFVAANAILSPLAAWEQHSRAALRLIRLWREAGSPSDPKSVARIVERLNPYREDGEKTPAGDKIYASTNWPNKSRQLQKLLTLPQKYINDIAHVAASRRGKIVDFGRAFYDPTGVPLDTHMGKALVPTVEQVEHETEGPGRKALNTVLDRARQLRADAPLSHRLAREIGGTKNPVLHTALMDAQKRLVDKPAAYKAYKTVVAHAAHDLGWEPRQVQETAWTALVSIIAAKNLGIKPEHILKKLAHEDSFEAWNVGGLLTTPEVMHDVRKFGLDPRSVDDFKAETAKPPAVSGPIEPGDEAAYQAVAARVPPGKSAAGAWHPIQRSLENKARPSLF